MIVAIHQPNFLPWIGYFYKILRSDKFVFLDSVDYTKNNYINRNLIKTPNGSQWITVPVLTKGKMGTHIKDMGINTTVNWRKQIVGTLKANYGKAPFFKELFPSVNEIIENADANLALLNINLIKAICHYLGIHKEMVLSSELNVEGKSNDLLINICATLAGDTYLSGVGAAKYTDHEKWETAGIKLWFTPFKHPQYTQLWGDFSPNMSIVDLIFNVGPDSRKLISQQDE